MQAIKEEAEMKTLCICIRCEKPRGCNATDIPENFVYCENCKELRENCLKKVFLEVTNGGTCYFCQFVSVWRNRKGQEALINVNPKELAVLSLPVRSGFHKTIR